MKKIITMILCVATCLSMTTMCNAAFSNAAKETQLFVSYAGYAFDIDDYYNVMKKYTGRGEYRSEWINTESKDESYRISNCWIDSLGKLHVSITTKYTTGKYKNCGAWIGIACDPKGNFNMTYTNTDGEYYDIAWSGVYQIGTYTYYDTDIKQNVSEKINNLEDFLMTEECEFFRNSLSDTIREVFWKDVNYDCTAYNIY